MTEQPQQPTPEQTETHEEPQPTTTRRKARTQQQPVETTSPSAEQPQAPVASEVPIETTDEPVNSEDFDPNDTTLSGAQLRAGYEARKADRSVYLEESRKAQEAADPSLQPLQTSTDTVETGTQPQ